AKNCAAQACSSRRFCSQLRPRWSTTRAAKTPEPMTSQKAPSRIYIDADACPVKDEIYRFAMRHGLPVSVVAGKFIRVPQDPLIERVAAGSGMVVHTAESSVGAGHGGHGQ